MHKRKVLNWSLAIVLATFFLITSQAFAIKDVYEDFSDGYLEESKWEKNQFVREVVGGKLISGLDGSPQWDGYLFNRTRFVSPESIYAIQADVAVNSTNLTLPDIQVVFAGLEGGFYHNNSNNVDVWAGIYPGNDGNGIGAWWRIWEVHSDGSMVILNEDELIAPGGLNQGITYETKIEHDTTDNEFIFRVGTDEITVSTLQDGTTSLPSNDDAPIFPYHKSLTTGIMGTFDEGYGSVFAEFDNVKINNNATTHDAFGAPLSTANWLDLEEVTEVSGGRIRLDIRKENENKSNNLPLKYSNTPYLEAKISVDEAQFTGSTNKKARARIWGWYFNTKRGPGSGQPYDGRDGDVFVQLALTTYDDSGVTRLRAEATADETNQDETAWNSILAGGTPHVFLKSVSFDTEYILSIEFTGTSLIFTIADSDGSNPETFTHNITGGVYEPSGYTRCISTRAYASGDGDIYIKGFFDDVRVDFSKLYGVVVDDNNDPMDAVDVSYWNDTLEMGDEITTDPDGSFEFLVPNGEVEFSVEPTVDSELCWYNRHYYVGQSLGLAENRDLGTIKLQKGALVTGHIYYADAPPGQLIEFWVGGKFEQLWGETDTSGYFEFRLPLGSYLLNLEDDQYFVMVPAEIDVTDVNTTYNLDTLPAGRPNAYRLMYDMGSGAEGIVGNVSGVGTAHQGEFAVVSFLNDQEITPDNLGGIAPLGANYVDPVTGNYGLMVPPTADYDRNNDDVKVGLVLMTEGPDDTESITVVDSALDVTTPNTVNLTYASEGQTVQGYIKDNVTGQGIYYASVSLFEQSTEQFAGVAETDHNGRYVFYNVQPATYRLGAVAQDYADTEWSANFDVTTADVLVEDILLTKVMDELVADFGSDGIGADGIWSNDGSSWSQIASSDPEDLLVWGTNLVADFGSDGIGADGIWAIDGSSWNKIATSDPENVLVWAGDLIGDFGSDGIDADGIWSNDGSSWSQIASSDPENMLVWGGNLVADFGSDGIGDDGIYVNDGSSWSQIAGSDPENLVVWGGNLVADFGSDGIDADGIWSNDGSSWSQIASSDPENMLVWGGNLIGDFGSDGIGADGIWSNDGSSWSKIANSDPEELLVWGTELVADFGSDGIDADGIWANDGSSWGKIANSDPEELLVWGTELVADFGSDGIGADGIWANDGSSWNKIANSDPDSCVVW